MALLTRRARAAGPRRPRRPADRSPASTASSTSAGSRAAATTPTSAARRSRSGCPPPASATAGTSGSAAGAGCRRASRSPTTGGPSRQFAAYAAHTRTPEFAAALDEVLAEAAAATVAVMCSESVWWRCHRRLIADVAVLGAGRAGHAPDARRPADPAPPVGGRGGRADGAVRWPAPRRSGFGDGSGGRTIIRARAQPMCG